MKKLILFSSCALLFLLTTACTKENQTVSLLSAHTWVITSTSLGGVAGDEYKMYDNRLFIHYQGGYIINDGQWAYQNRYGSRDSEIIGMRVDSDLGELYFDIDKLTTTELQLTPVDYSGWTPITYPTITLTPKS